MTTSNTSTNGSGVYNVTIKNPYLAAHDHHTTITTAASVGALKQQLQREYPTHPHVDDTRLIFGGRVIDNDTLLATLFHAESTDNVLHIAVRNRMGESFWINALPPTTSTSIVGSTATTTASTAVAASLPSSLPSLIRSPSAPSSISPLPSAPIVSSLPSPSSMPSSSSAVPSSMPLLHRSLSTPSSSLYPGMAPSVLLSYPMTSIHDMLRSPPSSSLQPMTPLPSLSLSLSLSSPHHHHSLPSPMAMPLVYPSYGIPSMPLMMPSTPLARALSSSLSPLAMSSLPMLSPVANGLRHRSLSSMTSPLSMQLPSSATNFGALPLPSFASLSSSIAATPISTTSTAATAVSTTPTAPVVAPVVVPLSQAISESRAAVILRRVIKPKLIIKLVLMVMLFSHGDYKRTVALSIGSILVYIYQVVMLHRNGDIPVNDDEDDMAGAPAGGAADMDNNDNNDNDNNDGAIPVAAAAAPPPPVAPIPAAAPIVAPVAGDVPHNNDGTNGTNSIAPVTSTGSSGVATPTTAAARDATVIATPSSSSLTSSHPLVVAAANTTFLFAAERFVVGLFASLIPSWQPRYV